MNHVAISEAPVEQPVEPARLYRLRPIPPGLSVPRPAPHAEQPRTDGRIFHLDARFESGGTWAGVEQLVEAAYLGLLKAGADDVIKAHLLELHLALPQYRDRVRPKYLSLTETVGADERTRFYALDHAYRLVHGLVNVVLQWKRLADDPSPWTVVAWNFDDAEHLARRFFTELARRAAPGREVDVVVETEAELDFPPLISEPLISASRRWLRR